MAWFSGRWVMHKIRAFVDTKMEYVKIRAYFPPKLDHIGRILEPWLGIGLGLWSDLLGLSNVQLEHRRPIYKISYDNLMTILR